MSYKQSRRREDDLAIVNAGLRVLMKPIQENAHKAWRVEGCRLAYGGMSYKTVMATNTQKALIGR